MGAYRETREWRDVPHRTKTDEIAIRFFIDYQDAEHKSVSAISAEIFRTSNPSEICRVQALKFDQNIKFHHVFNANYTVHGWLRWRTGLHVSYAQQIVGRVETGNLGEPDYWNYDGFMIGFGTTLPQPTPDVPKPHPDVPSPAQSLADAMIIADEQLEMAELFPFVYIKPWPKLAANLVKQGFMLVPPDVESTAFYTKLVGSTGEQKRSEAVAFINDTISPTEACDYRDEFLTPRAALSAPYEKFLDFPPHLRSDCNMIGLNKWVQETFESWDKLAETLAIPDAATTLINLWNSVIALMITMGYDHIWLSKLISLLQVNHLITTVLSMRKGQSANEDVIILSGPKLTRMIQAILLLPDKIFPIFPSANQATPPTIQPYSVGAIRTVHYKPDRYLLGDVQRIEIVAQGETRQEVYRRLSRAETTDEERSGLDANMIRACDTTTADLINQVQKTLSDRVSATTVNNYQTDYGLPNTNSMKITGNWWVQDQPAGGYLKDISKFARDIMERTVKTLRHESMQRRKLRIYEEAETTETRTLSNVSTSGDQQTVYRWVNREYKLETKSSEDRLVFELFLDVPSESLLQAVSKRCNIAITAPISPEQLGVKTYKDISPDARGSTLSPGSVYYLDVFDIYGIPPDECVPPATRIVTSGLLSRNPVCESSIDIPPGYLALQATATVTSFSKNPQVQVVVGGVNLAAQTDGNQTFKGDFSTTPARYASQMWASVLCIPASAVPPSSTDETKNQTLPDPDLSPQQGTREFENFYAFTLQVQCTRSNTTLASWQMKTFQKIQSAYQQALMHFNATMKEYQKILQGSPARLLMDIVQDQLIQCAIAKFTEIALTRSEDVAEGNAERDFSPRYAQFLRNAFDWEGMAVELFHEIDGGGTSLNHGQSEMLSLFSSSGYFLDFIQAKQARLMLSVKPDYARTLLLAFRTGEIWPCDEGIAPCTSADMNIVELLLDQRKTPSDHTQDQWTITLPTQMIALSRQDPFL